MVKLPTITVVREAFAYVWHNRVLFLRLILPGYVVLVGAKSILVVVSGNADPLRHQISELVAFVYSSEPITIPTTSFMLGLTYLVVGTLIFVLFSVAWHRSYLVPDEAQTVRTIYCWRTRHTQFLAAWITLMFSISCIAWSYAAFVIPFIGGEIFSWDLDPQTLSNKIIYVISLTLLFGFYIVIYFWIFGWFSMLFPCTALGGRMTLRDTGRMSKGNRWRLFCILGLVMVLVAVVDMPFEYLLHRFAHESGANASLVTTLPIALETEFFAFIRIAVSVTALSIAYRLLRAPGVTTSPTR